MQPQEVIQDRPEQADIAVLTLTETLQSVVLFHMQFSNHVAQSTLPTPDIVQILLALHIKSPRGKQKGRASCLHSCAVKALRRSCAMSASEACWQRRGAP